MKSKKKELFYFLRPSLFYDSNNTNEGDFEGLLKKKEYFQKFQVDNVVFPNLLKIYDVKNNTDLKKIFDSKGYLESLIDLIYFFKSKKINVGVKFDVSDLNNEYSIFLKIQKFYNNGKNPVVNDTNDFYLVEENSLDNNLKSNFSKFEIMAKFFLNIGFNFFIFENLDILFNSKNFDNNLNLLNLYKNAIQKINEKSYVLGEFKNFDFSNIQKVEKSKIFQKIIIYNLSYIGIKNEKKISTNWRTHLRKINSKNNWDFVVLSLNNDDFGWFFSRNGKENLYSENIMKGFFLFQVLIKNDFLIFSGEEIGSLRSKNINYKNNVSKNWLIKRMELKNRNWTKKNIEDYRNFIHPTNINTVFNWNSNENAGFNSNLERKNLSFQYKKFNLEDLENNKSSIWNFYLMLLRLKNNEKMIDIMSNFKYNISYNIFNKNAFEINYKNKNKNIKILLNFSSKPTKIFISKKYKVLVTTYSNKKYDENVKFLDPYESLIAIKNIEMKF
ncbi:glucan 1,6-alpha- (dextran) glucosidase [[Mycoplasma] mobile]|uniref:Glucan 1,6-alpha-(Dextran) glucosidase n=1 Tax=Mycoplasma mobile (strain ATCC 43663 / 163K / NCTC 11711) TaxID=267748 RepID=Q6KHT1_MYCM1|nr:glucan 1,6-alpha- (dextran) glucosidase [[Mycoplasma] mobile]AAT27847.1 glucan 1,6-alpha- (dextran) glucosidase [Mycoplasma mobile 163K]